MCFQKFIGYKGSRNCFEGVHPIFFRLFWESTVELIYLYEKNCFLFSILTRTLLIQVASKPAYLQYSHIWGKEDKLLGNLCPKTQMKSAAQEQVLSIRSIEAGI